MASTFWISTSSLRTVVSSGCGSRIPISIACPDHNCLSSLYLNFSSPDVSSITPSKGTSYGNFYVTILGSQFPNDPSLVVAVGEVLWKNCSRSSQASLICFTEPGTTQRANSSVFVRSCGQNGSSLALFFYEDDINGNFSRIQLFGLSNFSLSAGSALTLHLQAVTNLGNPKTFGGDTFLFFYSYYGADNVLSLIHI